MLRRATALGIISSVILTVAGPMAGTQNSRAQAADVGGYVIGAGLGLLLGSLLYRNTGSSAVSPSYYGGSTAQPQPSVVYGWYNDGFSQTYGPIVVPPPGYVQPSTSVTGTIINPATGLPVTGTVVNSATGSPITGTVINPATGMPITGTIINPATGTPVTGYINPATGLPVTGTVIDPSTGLPVTGDLVNGQAAPTTTTTTTPATTTPTTTAKTTAKATKGTGSGAAGTTTAATTGTGAVDPNATGIMAQRVSATSMVHSLGSRISSMSRAATSTVRSSAVHSAMQRVSRGSVSMIKNQAGRSLGRVF